MIHHDEVYAISRDATPAPKKVSNVKDCSASDVTLQLSAASQSVPVGGSLDFTATIVHEGSGNCLVDGSDSGRVLTITSGQETIYKSDVCPADSRLLLMAKGDKDVRRSRGIPMRTPRSPNARMSQVGPKSMRERTWRS